ncbi:MAG TPA: zinc ribbon domain-containing protein [Candidatus Limnocylindria bacterium]
MARFCPSCGTEVDETAVFCPTCGQPIDQDAETQMPAAPAWPEPDERARPVEPAPEPPPAAAVPPVDDRAAGWERGETPLREGYVPSDITGDEPSHVEPTRVEPRPEFPRPPDPRVDPGPESRPEAGRPAVDLPITMPVTLSAWLIGIGAALGAVGALIGLFDGFGSAIDLLALLALLVVAAAVFFSAALPAIPHLRFITLAVVLVAFGVALDRLGFGRAGAGDLLLFLGSAAAVIGAVLLELGHDQPLSGPQS